MEHGSRQLESIRTGGAAERYNHHKHRRSATASSMHTSTIDEHKNEGKIKLRFLGVKLVYWNPRRSVRVGSIGLRLPFLPRVNNFGDMLAPIIVPAVHDRRRPVRARSGAGRLLSVGSILHFAEDGDVVWGTGVNGKVPVDQITARSLRVCSVRGPRTAEVLSAIGIETPSVFADPGLLLPSLLGVAKNPGPVHEITSIPNLNDRSKWVKMPGVIDPRADPLTVLQRIADSRFVVSSSLHGLVLADALGVPCSWMSSANEPAFKYLDYFEGTNRYGLRPVNSISKALESPLPAPKWDSRALIEAFPIDLWGSP